MLFLDYFLAIDDYNALVVIAYALSFDVVDCAIGLLFLGVNIVNAVGSAVEEIALGGSCGLRNLQVSLVSAVRERASVGVYPVEANRVSLLLGVEREPIEQAVGIGR